MERKIERDRVRYERVSECKKRRVEAQQKEQAAQALLEMSAQQGRTTSEKPTSSTMTELTADYITNLETKCVRKFLN